MYSKLPVVPSDIFFKAKKSEINQKIPSRESSVLQKLQGLLNSKRIYLLFGHYDVEVLFQEGCLRVTNLNSRGVMRTYAIVHFSSLIPAAQSTPYVITDEVQHCLAELNGLDQLFSHEFNVLR